MASGLTDHVWSIGEVLRYKWHLCRGSNRNDVDDQKSSQSKHYADQRQSFRLRIRPLVRLRKGSCARPPVSGALPSVEEAFLGMTLFLFYTFVFVELSVLFQRLRN